MTTSILSPSEQRIELAALVALAGAISIAAENYEFREMDDKKLQAQCESVFVNLVPELAERMSNLYDSAHEILDDNAWRKRTAVGTAESGHQISAKSQKLLSDILDRAGDDLARALAACDCVGHDLQLLRMPGLLSSEEEGAWKHQPEDDQSAPLLSVGSDQS